MNAFNKCFAALQSAQRAIDIAEDFGCHDSQSRVIY